MGPPDVLGVGRDGPLGVAQGGPGGGTAGDVTVGPSTVGPSTEAPPSGTPRRAAGPRAAGSALLAGAPRSPLAERDAWIVLASVEGLGPVTFGALLRAAGSARHVLEIAAGRGGALRLVAAVAAEGLRMSADLAAQVAAARDEAPSLLARLAGLGVGAVTAEEEAYPARLRAIELPPPVLFVRGEVAALAAARPVAIVGTRRPTEDGRRTAAHLAAALAATGATVVSGLAVGIDGSAHAGALLAGGTTVAVLGSGHARLYPAAHADLAREIGRSGGAVVAELPPDAEPRPAGFPRRNRVIAGLADATVVVEAGERSGALITASWALEQGRAVFACPGPIDRPQAVGCNRLLRDHPGEVRIVVGSDELIADLDYGIPLAVRRRRPDRGRASAPDPGAIVARLGPAEAGVVRRLLHGPATADVLAGAADLPGATVLAVLTRLEEEGLVVATFGRYRLAGALAGVRAAGSHT
jgi:DNA processing protein